MASIQTNPIERGPLDTGRSVFGLVGAGKISHSQHLPNLTRSRNIYLKTVCDLNSDLLNEVQSKYSIPESTTSFQEMLDDPEIDAVVIATKAEAHASLTVQALECGKHVYVEKPLAETVEECRRVVDAQKKSGKIAAVGFNRRLSPAYRMAKSLIDTHGGAMNMHYRLSDTYWLWGSSLGSGRRVIHELCHVIDILRYLAGSEVKSVYCISARPDDEAIAMQFESGCVATIMSTGYVQWDMPKERLEVITELGGFMVNDFVELQTYGYKDAERIYRFAGRRNEYSDHAHKYLFSINGERSMLDIRRACFEQYSRLEQMRSEGIEGLERDELEDFALKVVWFANYMVDKGWAHALDHLSECIQTGRKCELAGPEDGLWAARIADAVIECRDRHHQAVSFDK